MANEGLHEAADRLDEAVVDRHRAITSIMEELEAVDWYDQRVSATDDASLAAVLAHNRDEEKEHMAMTLEWLRRHDPVLDRHLRTYLFTEDAITEIEHEVEHESGDAADGSLGTGDLHREGIAVNHLLRDLAPVSEEGWQEIEGEAKRSLSTYLAGRKLVDFNGPHGWTKSSVHTGRFDVASAPPLDGVRALVRRVQPLVELRTEFDVARAELDAIDRGSRSPDLDSVVDAARRLAEAEDLAIFRGYSGGGIEGIAEASPHDTIAIPDDYEDYPRPVAKAVATLRTAGVDGPYGIALGPRCYTGVIETTRGGYPVLEHLRLILGGPVIWAPAVDGAVVVSLRGGDFELVAGVDVSIGYRTHGPETVSLYLEESMTFRIHGPEASVALVYERAGKPRRS